MVDRTWYRGRISSERLGENGGVIPRTCTTSFGDEFGTNEDEFKDYLKTNGYYLERTYDCASVKFSYEDSHPEYAIAAYRVDWEFIPNHISNHKGVLYYALLDMQVIDFDVITEVIGNRTYMKRGINQFGIWNVISDNPHLKDELGRYTTYPDPMLAVVATAIGLDALESKVVKK